MYASMRAMPHKERLLVCEPIVLACSLFGSEDMSAPCRLLYTLFRCLVIVFYLLRPDAA
jgi:hypothetical protein